MPNDKHRLTFVKHTVHQVVGKNPTAISTGCTRILSEEADEQVYSRTPKTPLGPEWQQVKLGWVEKVALVSITNNEPATEEPFNPDTDPGIMVRYPDQYDFFWIYPGESLEITPSDPKNLWFACSNGTAAYTLTIFPG